jgi:hypothetical protein
MRRILALLALVLTALPAFAECTGRNLLDALPPDTRARIEAAADAAPFPEGNRWLAEKPGSRITVVGTLHLNDPRMDGPIQRLKPEIAAADAVYLEATDAELTALKDAVGKHPDILFVQSGPTLPDRLSKNEWLDVQREAGLRGIPGIFAAKMQPWYLVVLLGLPPCLAADLAGKSEGLDKLVMAAAADAKVPTKALEPWDTVIKVFGAMPPDQQIEMLRAAMAMTGQAEDQFATLIATYFSEQHRLLWELSRETALAAAPDRAQAEKDFALLENVLLLDRNRVWLDTLIPAAEGRRLVVAVGAAHLSGQGGILEGLKDAGYTVTRQEF